MTPSDPTPMRAPPARRARLTPCLALALVLTASAGCDRLGRTGEACDREAACAVGLRCLDGYCHHPSNGRARALSPLTPPSAWTPDPNAQNSARVDQIAPFAEAVQGVVLMTPYATRGLPDSLTTTSGVEATPAPTALALGELLSAVHQKLENINVGPLVTVNAADAARHHLHPLQSPDGHAAVVGLTLEASGSRVVLGALTSPDTLVPRIAAAIWRLGARQRGPVSVGFICDAAAFCPIKTGLPARRDNRPWPPEVHAALEAIHGPLQSVQKTLKTELDRAGIDAQAVSPGATISSDWAALVLAAPQAPLPESTRAWITQAQRTGTPTLMLLPAARYRASRGDFVNTDGSNEALLEGQGLRPSAPLLADRAAMTDFQVPRLGVKGTLPTPVSTEVVRIREDLGGFLMASNLPLPLVGTFSPTERTDVTPVAWSRAGVVPVTLPTPATLSDLATAAPPGTGQGARPLVYARDGDEVARTIIIGSDLGLSTMTTARLLSSLDLQDKALTSTELVSRLAPYALGAERYRTAAAANGTSRERGFQHLERMLRWLAEPPGLKALKQAAPSGPQ